MLVNSDIKISSFNTFKNNSRDAFVLRSNLIFASESIYLNFPFNFGLVFVKSIIFIFGITPKTFDSEIIFIIFLAIDLCL